MGVQHGPLRLALLGRTNVPGGALQPCPCSGCRNSDRKTRRRLMRRLPALDRRNNALTQIHAVRLAHPILPNRSQRWNQHSASKRILSDSLFEEFALISACRGLVESERLQGKLEKISFRKLHQNDIRLDLPDQVKIQRATIVVSPGRIAEGLVKHGGT